MDRRLRFVLLALVASGSADGFLPVVESFAVLRVTGSVGKFGLVLACQAAVGLIVTLVGGLAGDRFLRGRILIVSSVVRMTAAATMAAALLTGTASFGLLLGMAGVYGCADGFFAPASTALLPDVVPLAHLASANALIGGISSSARIAAPAIAGVIVASLGTGAGFVVQAALLAVAGVSLAAGRLPADRAGRAPGVNALRELRAGWAEFARLRWLWLLTGEWTAFSMIVLAPVAVLGPAIAERYLGGALAWGAIGSCLSLGGVAGQIVAGRMRPGRPAFVIACLVPVMTVEALALGLGAPLAVVAAAAVITGFAMGIQAVLFQTALQTSVPAAVLARVTAFDLVGSEGGQPIGYALAGPAAMAVGAHNFLAASAAGMVVGAAAFTCLRPLRDAVRCGRESPRPVRDY